MKFDKICRVCLVEKTALKPIFNACIPNMLMSCAAVQVIEGDGLPHQICTQCLQTVNRSYTFKTQCEKSDGVLRAYFNSIGMMPLEATQSIISGDKNDHLFGPAEVLQQSSIFNDIFDDAETHSLVDNFTSQNADLAETMQSLRTIAEQCLPATWDNEQNLTTENVTTTCDGFSLEQLYKCQFCEEMFKDEWSLAEHIKVHTGQAKYYCEIGVKECNTPGALENHLHDNALDRNVEKKKMTYTCNLCGKEWGDVKTLKKHYRDEHAEENNLLERKFVCNICGKRYLLRYGIVYLKSGCRNFRTRYKQNKLLVIHARSHTGERPLSCDVCGKAFSLPSSLHKHKLTHNEIKKHKCNLCGKSFHQSSNLNAHIKTHTGEKPFVCNICEKRCSTNGRLEIHLRSHTGLKPYRCLKCDAAFTTRGQLKKHNLRHTGELPYKCWHCGKSFRQKDTRDTHVRYHTGDRPYACSFCPKKYIAASHLRVHMKTHTGLRKFQCSICCKSFAESKTLKTHVMTHTGQKAFHCSVCGKGFIQQGAFNVHVRNCHI